jgi:hypothetical protein
VGKAIIASNPCVLKIWTSFSLSAIKYLKEFHFDVPGPDWSTEMLEKAMSEDS